MLPGSDELAPGLHRWTAFHPEWKQDVASVAVVTAGDLVLVDPLAPPALAAARRFWKALDRAVDDQRTHVDVVLTLHYHVRSAPAVVERYRSRFGAALWAPTGSAQRIRTRLDHAFAPGDRLPGGMEALPGGLQGEVVIWVPHARALVTGDVLLGGLRKPYRVCPPSWLPTGASRSDVARALMPLLDLDVELLVPTHGPPVTSCAREALAAALDEAGTD